LYELFTGGVYVGNHYSDMYLCDFKGNNKFFKETAMMALLTPEYEIELASFVYIGRKFHELSADQQQYLARLAFDHHPYAYENIAEESQFCAVMKDLLGDEYMSGDEIKKRISIAMKNVAAQLIDQDIYDHITERHIDEIRRDKAADIEIDDYFDKAA
jgi:hypothetical protein